MNNDITTIFDNEAKTYGMTTMQLCKYRIEMRTYLINHGIKILQQKPYTPTKTIEEEYKKLQTVIGTSGKKLKEIIAEDFRK